MNKTSRSILLSAFFATALVACGGGGGGGDDSSAAPAPAPTPPPAPADVTLDKLAGTWFGTFDPDGTVQTMEITMDAAGNITVLKLEGATTDITGTVTKATTPARAFRFQLRTANNADLNSGILLTDPSGTYLLFVDRFSSVGVIQKGATALPTYVQADIEKSWTGDRDTTTAGFSTLDQASTTASCKTATATTSDCTITITGGPSRAGSSLASTDPRGRWIGSYTDTGPSANGSIRAYLSADKAFAGVLACTNFAFDSFPSTCDFSTWKQ